MSNANGKISAPINIETDVYKVLGLARQAGGYDIAYACTSTHGKINPWAKFKPTRGGGPDTAADSWQGTAGQCGFEMPEYSQPGTLDIGLIAGLASGDAVWKYLAPRPNVDWFRTTDFDGYNHMAGDPFPHVMAGTIHKSSTGKLVIPFQHDPVQANGNLAVADIKHRGNPLTNYYVGVAIWNSSKRYYDIARTPGINVDSMEFTLFTVPSGAYKAAVFLSSVPLSGDVGGMPMPQAGYYIAAGTTAPAEITIADYLPDYAVQARGSKVRGKYTVDCVGIFINNTASPYVFENVRFLVTTLGANNIHALAGQTQLLGGVTVPANSSKSVSMTVDVLPNAIVGQEEPTYYVQVTSSAASSDREIVMVTIA